MARMENGRFTARVDETFVVFRSGVWFSDREGSLGEFKPGGRSSSGTH